MTGLAAVSPVLERDPSELLAALPLQGGSVWVRRGEGLVGSGAALRVDLGTGRERFARADTALADFAAEGGLDVGFISITFDPDSSGSVLVIPERLVAKRGGRIAVAGSSVDPAPPPTRLLAAAPRVRFAGSSLDELAWLEAVAAMAAEVRGPGPLEKVVLARDHRVRGDEPFDVRAVVARLCERFADCYTFVVDGLVGATPELLLRRRGRRIESQVLAGSAPRGADAGEDARLGEGLCASTKDAVEHRLAVESAVAALGPLCSPLVIEPVPSLLRLSNVQHLATRMEGELVEPATLLDVAAVLHPTAAVGGTPTETAVARIRELEGMDRGRYAGPVGWTDTSGDGELGIALRCAVLDGDRARLFAGAGIVGDSLPERELEETRLKLRAMQAALEEGR